MADKPPGSSGRLLALAIGVGVIPSAVLLLVTAAQSPVRAIAGLFFLVVMVPGLQTLLAAFSSWRIALAAGSLVPLLTTWQVLAPRALVQQPIQWPAGFTDGSQQYKTVLYPPTRRASGATHAQLFVCLSHGSGDDLLLAIDGRALAGNVPLEPPSCWLRIPLDLGHLPQDGGPLVISVQPVEGRLPAPERRSVMIGGYTRPRNLGGQSGGATFFDGVQWRGDDLSPLVDGAQQGRLFVEVRLLDQADHVVEVWY